MSQDNVIDLKKPEPFVEDPESFAQPIKKSLIMHY